MANLINDPLPTWFAGLAFFDGLNALELGCLAERARRYRLHQGRMLFDLGSRPRALYILAGGQVSLWARPAGGDEQMFHSVRPGEAFGIADLLSSGPCSHMAWAQPGSTVILVPRDVVFMLMRDSPIFVKKLFANVCDQLQALEERQERGPDEPAGQAWMEKLKYMQKDCIQNANYH